MLLEFRCETTLWPHLGRFISLLTPFLHIQSNTIKIQPVLWKELMSSKNT